MNRHLLSAACATFLLAACGGGDDDDDSAPPAAAATPQYTLTVTATDDFPGSYGSVGAYERLHRHAVAARSTRRTRQNAIIQDLALAPVNARGIVEYKAEFVMLKPKDMSKANGVLRYDAPNRGNILTLLNPAATPSDAEYLERGYTLLYSAWQGDVPKSNPARLTLTVPVAKNADGSSITGPYRAELIPSAASAGDVAAGRRLQRHDDPLRAGEPRQHPARLLADEARSRRPTRASPIPAADWKFADCNADRQRRSPARRTAPRSASRAASIRTTSTSWSTSPRTRRSWASAWPRCATPSASSARPAADAAGTANPLAGRISHAIGQGTSQSGNAMKTFLHLGFNEALDGSKVFDGLYAHVAARQTNINTRFAVPGGGGAHPHRPHGLRPDGAARPRRRLPRRRRRPHRRRDEALHRDATPARSSSSASRARSSGSCRARRC